MIKVLVLGATGATGRELVDQLLANGALDEIHVFVRRDLGIRHTRLHTHIVDFEHPEAWRAEVSGDIAFSCLGTTLRDAGSKAAQRRVDVDYQVAFAEAARAGGVKTFALLSSMGADAESRYFYMRIKGEVEEAVRALGFERTLIFRPGLLDRGLSARLNERISLMVIRALNRIGLLRNQHPTTTAHLAGYMLHASLGSDLGERIFSLSDLHA